MNRPDLEPPGFQPELLEYFTRFEVKNIGNCLLSFRNARTVGEMVDRAAKGEDQRRRYTYAISVIQQLGRVDLKPASIEGAHIWSTVLPNTFQTELIRKEDPSTTRKSPNYRVILTEERRGLLKFFRQNIADLPVLTRDWFALPNPWRRVSLGEGLPGVYNPFDFENLAGNTREFIGSLRRSAAHPENTNPLKLIDDVNRQILVGEERFKDEIDSSRVVRYWGFMMRSSVVGYQLEQGGLRYPSRLRYLASLSIAADLMRAEIAFGQLSGRTAMTDCFNFAGMEFLGRRVAEKIVGEPVEVVYGDTLNPTPKYSTVYIQEIADIQQRITSAIQHLL